MSNSIKVLAEEHPTYFLCSRRDIPQLVARAEEESDCGLLFLHLNEVMLNRMIQLGIPSGLTKGGTATR